MKPKQFRRGEAIYKVGEPATHVYIVQSGLVSVMVQNGEKMLVVGQIGANQILGEEALWGATRWNATAAANNDVVTIPIEANEARKLIEASSQIGKIYSRGLLEKLRTWSEALLGIKIEEDLTPCPPHRVTKLFATLYHVVNYTGTRKKDEITIVWPSFKKYAQRIFLESPVRLEQAVNVLVNLGYARLEFIPCETDPDAPDELGFVHFSELEPIREFFEFHRRKQFPTKDDKDSQPSPECLAFLREIEAWNEKGKVILTGGATDGSAA